MLRVNGGRGEGASGLCLPGSCFWFFWQGGRPGLRRAHAFPPDGAGGDVLEERRAIFIRSMEPLDDVRDVNRMDTLCIYFGRFCWTRSKRLII